MSYEYIPITKAEIPTSMTLDLDDNGAIYRYQFDYNESGDYYTLAVLNDETSEILYTSRVVYGADILHAGHVSLGITSRIVPVDFDGVITEVNSETFDNILFVVM